MVNYTPKIARDSKDAQAKKNQQVVLVKELASRVIIHLLPEDPILEAQDKLQKHQLSGSPVVNEDGIPVGYLSERDCLVRIMDMKYHNDISVKVKSLMSQECQTIVEDDNIMKAVEIFSAKSFHLLPVVDTKGVLTGLLSRHVVFRYVVNLKQQNW